MYDLIAMPEGFSVYREGRLVAYLRKSGGWTRSMVEEVVDLLDSVYQAGYDSGCELLRASRD